MNKMKLPPEIQFHQDIPLLVYRPRGLIGEVALNNVISVIEELEAATQEPFYRFFDTLSAHEVELNFKYIIQVSLHRHLAYAGRPPLKSAILATDATTIHYGRLHALLTQGSPITVRVFQHREEAAHWLGVPIELLAAEPADEKHSAHQEALRLVKPHWLRGVVAGVTIQLGGCDGKTPSFLQ
jgi:hypothetical protein